MRGPRLRQARPGDRAAGSRSRRRRAGDRHQAPRLRDQPARGVRGRGGGAARRGARRRVGRAHARARRRPWSSCATRMAIGIDRAIHLVTDGEEWDPQATAAAIVEAIRADEAANGPFDLILLGNESADSRRLPGRRSGSRTRSAGRSRPGSRASPSTAAPSAASRRSAAGRDVYELPLPAVVTRARGAQPAALPVRPGRLRAKTQAASRRRRRRGAAPRLEMVRLVVPQGEAKQAEVLGEGADAAPAVVEVLAAAGGARDDASLVYARARGRRRRRRRRSRRSRWPAGSRPATRCTRSLHGDDVRAVGVRLGRTAPRPSTSRSTTALAPHAPDALARAIGRPRRPRLGADARRRPGHRGGQHGPRARRGRCSTCRSRRTASRVTPGDPPTVTARALGRQPPRGGARCTRRPRDPHGRAARGRGAPSDGGPATVEPFTPELADADLVVRVRRARRGRRRRASRSPTPRSSSPAGAASARRRASRRSRSSRRCSAAPSAAPAR